MSGLAFMIHAAKTLKVVGRKRISFHLDQLVLVGKSPDISNATPYFWLCRMGEVDPHNYGAGVMCQAHGMGYSRQFNAEEDALSHLVNVHRATGGERRPKGRGRERRQREIDAWNARHVRSE